MKTGSKVALEFLPCLDSEAYASGRQEDLDIPRKKAARLGKSAVAAIAKGFYRCNGEARVGLKDQVRAMQVAKMSIAPDAELPDPPGKPFAVTRVQVSNETTLGAARRLFDEGQRPLALNFANGIHPGGGFLNGALAQEEVLCRSSALYAALEGDPMYDAHRKRLRPDSTAWAILSPDVPVFRTDQGIDLPEPWLLSIITCAAPYAPAIGQPESGDALQLRIERVLAIARAYGFGALVLGAWGCGAFRNDPHRTAADFRTALEGEFRGAFSAVVFAVTDWSPERQFLGPFRDAFAR